MKRSTIAVISASLLLALPSAARAQDSAPAPQAASASTRPFTIGPGDVVRVKIWREKDLDGDFQVDERGRLILPLLGPIDVRGIQWSQLRDSLLVLYRRELKAPAVTLTPLRRVYALGEVMKPGPYLADPTVSIAGILALAGGTTPLGDLHHIRIVRGGRVIVRNASIEDQMLSDAQSDDQIFVDQRSWFSRNSTFLASAAISVTSIIVALVRQ